MDDARDIWNAVKASLGRCESKKIKVYAEARIFQSIELLKQRDCTKDSMVDIKGYSTFFPQANLACPSHSGTLSGNVIEDVLQSFVADTEPEQQLAYEDFEQIEKMDLEEIDLKWQMAMLSVRVHKRMKEGRRFQIPDHCLKHWFDWTRMMGQSDGVIAPTSVCVKSSEPKSNDSTSCASTSSVSTSESEAEIESNVGTNHIQEPLFVQSSKCLFRNSSDENETLHYDLSCNKNGYFNKKAGHFRKNASSVSKLCFVCGSSTHLIKDCDFYEKQMANKTVGNGVGPVHSRNNVNHQNQFVPQAVLLRTGKVNIPPARPQPVPTGKPKVPAPVPTGRQNRPFPVPTDRGYSPSVTSGWWKSTARPMPHLNRPTSSYFQTYTPYVPQMYYNHMKYGGVRWATAVKPSAGCSWKTHRKGLYWENPYSDAEDEGIFDSGCSRSMTGNMERLDDFQEFQGGKVTFGGGEGRITGKGTIRTPTLDFENVYYDFMLPDESMVVLRVPRKHNLYTSNLNNLSPRGNLACLVAKALVDESVKWHRRMGHVNL
ncbi:hypothetical protein Tco_0817797 [Tanacetum coccineum]